MQNAKLFLRNNFISNILIINSKMKAIVTLNLENVFHVSKLYNVKKQLQKIDHTSRKRFFTIYEYVYTTIPNYL